MDSGNDGENVTDLRWRLNLTDEQPNVSVTYVIKKQVILSFLGFFFFCLVITYSTNYNY